MNRPGGKNTAKATTAVQPHLRATQKGNLARPHSRSPQAIRKPEGLAMHCLLHRGDWSFHQTNEKTKKESAADVADALPGQGGQRRSRVLFVCWLVGCLTSQQQASVSQGRICSDNLTCCHNEMEAADQTFHLTQSQYTDTVPTSPSAVPITPGAWQGSHWSANF